MPVIYIGKHLGVALNRSNQTAWKVVDTVDYVLINKFPFTKEQQQNFNNRNLWNEIRLLLNGNYEKYGFFEDTAQ